MISAFRYFNIKEPSLKTLSFAFPADSAHLELLGCFIERACLETESALVELVVDELVVNAIQHGAANRLEVQIEPEANSYQVWVLDNGKAFNPITHAPKPMGELREGGYGLAILHKVAHDLQYQRQDGWNRIGMRFNKGETQ